MSQRYRREVLDQLAVHGIRPTDTTPPQVVHDFVNDLYRYELRRLRDGLLGKDIAKSEYFSRVVRIRQRYPLLSLKLWQWLE